MANENEGVQTTATTTEQTKYLDKKGLETFWGKVKALVTAAVATIGSVTDDISERLTAHINNKSNPHGVTKAQVGLGSVTNDAQVKRSEMGKANGVATLDANGRVPLAQLGNLDTSLYIIPADNKLPTTGIKTNKIYLIKETSGTNNVYTEYIYVNNAWEMLGKFKTDVDLTPYAKTTYVEGELNKFPRMQLQAIKENQGNLLFMDAHAIEVSADDDVVKLAMSYADDNGTVGGDSVDFPKASATQPGTMSAADFTKLAGIATGANKTVVDSALSATSTNPVQNKVVNTELGKKLDKTGGTISGNLAVTGTLTKGGKAVLTDHQAIYSLTVQKNGTSVGTFTPKSANATVNITVPTKLSGFTDDVVKGKYLPLTGGNVVGDTTFKASNDTSATTTAITFDGITIGGTEYQKTSILINGDTDKEVMLPSKAGTIALTSDIPSINGKADIIWVEAALSEYLKKSGGIITGLVTFTYNGVANRILFDPSTGKVGAQSFVKANGTSTQALMADGSVAERIDETEIAAICV